MADEESVGIPTQMSIATVCPKNKFQNLYNKKAEFHFLKRTN